MKSVYRDDTALKWTFPCGGRSITMTDQQVEDSPAAQYMIMIAQAADEDQEDRREAHRRDRDARLRAHAARHGLSFCDDPVGRLTVVGDG